MQTTITPTDPQKRIIPLTGRAPVSIRTDEWPVIAAWSDEDHDGVHADQATRLWDCRMRVRQHADGRILVYGSYDYRSAFRGERTRYARAGHLLPAGAVIIYAIYQVRDELLSMLDGEYAEPVHEAARGCIAALPAEDI